MSKKRGRPKDAGNQAYNEADVPRLIRIQELIFDGWSAPKATVHVVSEEIGLEAGPPSQDKNVRRLLEKLDRQRARIEALVHRRRNPPPPPKPMTAVDMATRWTRDAQELQREIEKMQEFQRKYQRQIQDLERITRPFKGFR